MKPIDIPGPSRFIFHLLAAVLLALAGPLAAQQPPDSLSASYQLVDLTDPEAEAALFQVRPLDELMADALRHSPLLRSQELEMDNIEERMKLLRRTWADYLSLNGGYQYGNLLWIDNIETVFETSSRLTTRQNSFYSVGIGIRLPFSEFASKRPQMKMLNNELEQQHLAHQETERQLRQTVINYYQQLQLSLKTMKIKGQEVEFLRLATQLAEQYFREGALEVNEFTNTVRERSRAESELVEAQSEARLAYLLLREIVGVDLRR